MASLRPYPAFARPSQQPYGNTGPYKQGVWLVGKGGQGAVVDRSHLPAQGQGYQYYWLGTTQQEALTRLLDGMNKINVHAAPNTNLARPVNRALGGKVGDITPPQKGLRGFLQSATDAIWAFPSPGILGGGKAAGAAEGAAGAGADAGGAGGAVAGSGARAGAAAAGAFGAADLITSSTDFLSWIAWIFHPLNWLRMVEFIVGLLLGGMGIHLLTSRRGGVTAVARRRLISITPGGRVIRQAQGRRMGRQEGQREAARMEARQEQTLTQRQSSAVERERINLNARRQAREN